jgi:hypothetical protein
MVASELPPYLRTMISVTEPPLIITESPSIHNGVTIDAGLELVVVRDPVQDHESEIGRGASPIHAILAKDVGSLVIN